MERLISASLAELLDKAGPSIDSGGVNLFSVEGVRERSGARWPRKHEQVVTFVERVFSKLCQPGDVVGPLNATEFLTIQPTSSRAAALGLTAKVLKETLEFFIGAAAPQDLRLFQVTSFVDGELRVQAVSPERLTNSDHVDPQAAPPAARTAGPLMKELTWLTQRRHVALPIDPLGSLEVIVAAEPVWNTTAGAVASYALQPSLGALLPADLAAGTDPADMSPALAAAVAVAVIDRGAELLGSLSVRNALHLPLPLRALTFSTSRYRVLEALRALPANLRKFLILELVLVPEGLPPGPLAEVVSTLAPYGRAVLGRAAAETARIAAWRGCGLNGVSLDCSHLAAGDRQALAKLTSFVRSAQAVARPCVAYGLASRSLLMTAWAAGCTHLSGPAVSMGVPPLPGPVRFQPLDLFGADLRDATRADPAAVR